MSKLIRPIDLDGLAALVAAQRTTLRKEKGERDTAFIKRIVCAYLNAAEEQRLLRAGGAFTIAKEG